MKRLGLFTLGALCCARAVAAQGNLSTQGFGYPAGGLSTRAIASGAGFAEFDAMSTRNPASLLGWGRGGLYVEYAPEFRTVESGNQTDNTLTARFPLIAAGLPVGDRVMLALSASSLLDRSWATSFRSGQRLGPDSVTYLEEVRSTGGISDLRLAASYAFSSRVAVGVGVHAVGGENRLSLTRSFDDSAKFGTLRRNLNLGFEGGGISAGVVMRPIRSVALSASIGRGGSLEMKQGDTLLAKANGPNRWGAGIRLDAIEGMSLAASYERTEWSRLGALGSTGLGARDGADLGIGAEFLGPRMRTVPMTLHVGVRQRDLPFAAGGNEVTERQYAGGMSLPFGGPRAALDLGIVRATRSQSGGLSENAWILSFGLSVRP